MNPRRLPFDRYSFAVLSIFAGAFGLLFLLLAIGGGCHTINGVGHDLSEWSERGAE